MSHSFGKGIHLRSIGHALSHPRRSSSCIPFIYAIGQGGHFLRTNLSFCGYSAGKHSYPFRRARGGCGICRSQTILRNESTLRAADLLVLPYGSAVPVDTWPDIERYLHAGGNLLIIGGEPLHVPVARNAGSFVKERPQDTYSRALGFQHVYTVPVPEDVHFAWREGYSFLPRVAVRAQRYFAVEGRLNGLGYVETEDGTKAAAPVIVSDHLGDGMPGSRVVALDFDPKSGYWDSADGTSLIRAAAEYARKGATEFWVEAQYSTLRPGELPDLTLHLQRPGAQTQGAESQNGHGQERSQDYAMIELLSGTQRIDSARIALNGPRMDAAVPLQSSAGGFLYRSGGLGSKAVRLASSIQMVLSRRYFRARKWRRAWSGWRLSYPGRKAILARGHELFFHGSKWMGFFWPAQCVGLGKRLCGHGAAWRQLCAYRRVDAERQIRGAFERSGK